MTDHQLSDHSSLDPVPVLVLNHPEQADKSPDTGPDFSAWNSIDLLGTPGEKMACRLLPNSPRRARAVITIGPGANGNTLGRVFVGAEKLVTNGKGGILQNGQSVEIHGQEAVFYSGDGINSLVITTVDERWQ